MFGESGAEASIEEIAARAGVGIGTVYRRFASKDALIDELLRLSIETLLGAAEAALAAPPEAGLEQYLRACGQEFASHARYADLLLTRSADPAARDRLREALEELTARARRRRRGPLQRHRRRRHGADLGNARPGAGHPGPPAGRVAAVPVHPPRRDEVRCAS